MSGLRGNRRCGWAARRPAVTSNGPAAVDIPTSATRAGLAGKAEHDQRINGKRVPPPPPVVADIDPIPFSTASYVPEQSTPGRSPAGRRAWKSYAGTLSAPETTPGTHPPARLGARGPLQGPPTAEKRKAAGLKSRRPQSIVEGQTTENIGWHPPCGLNWVETGGINATTDCTAVGKARPLVPPPTGVHESRIYLHPFGWPVFDSESTTHGRCGSCCFAERVEVVLDCLQTTAIFSFAGRITKPKHHIHSTTQLIPGIRPRNGSNPLEAALSSACIVKESALMLTK